MKKDHKKETFKKKKKTFCKISTFLGVSIVALFIKEQFLSNIDYC